MAQNGIKNYFGSCEKFFRKFPDLNKCHDHESKVYFFPLLSCVLLLLFLVCAEQLTSYCCTKYPSNVE